MRNLLGIFSLLITTVCFAQLGSSPYANAKSTEYSSNKISNKPSFFSSSNNIGSGAEPESSTERIGNPDAVPINEYVPILLLVAGGLIVYFNRSNKSIALKKLK